MNAREGRPSDFPDLVRLAYGRAPLTCVVRDVRTEWDWYWRTGRLLTVAVEEGGARRTGAFMGALLITESMFQRLRIASIPFVNRRLGREPECGDRPLPAPEGLVDGSATLHIAYFGWDDARRPDEAAVLRGFLANAFLDLHGGYAVRRLSLELCGERALELARKQGAEVVNDYADWTREHAVPEAERPWLLAIDRERALETENHWYTRLFRYEPPILGLNVGQREMLLLARQGLTDLQIADRLSVTLDTVKKRWDSVYGRYRTHVPTYLPMAEGGKRGGEKRRLVLAHLHGRLEELRP